MALALEAGEQLLQALVHGNGGHRRHGLRLLRLRLLYLLRRGTDVQTGILLLLLLLLQLSLLLLLLLLHLQFLELLLPPPLFLEQQLLFLLVLGRRGRG